MPKNVLGTELEFCNINPKTGYFRDGKCQHCEQDLGLHTLCAMMTAEFLAFSKAAGNDLSTPVPEYDFKGLQPGDKWCICLGRWIEAYNAGAAPKVALRSTHESVLEHVPIEILQQYKIEDDPKLN